jgi:hypothetical protein
MEERIHQEKDENVVIVLLVSLPVLKSRCSFVKCHYSELGSEQFFTLDLLFNVSNSETEIIRFQYL